MEMIIIMEMIRLENGNLRNQRQRVFIQLGVTMIELHEFVHTISIGVIIYKELRISFLYYTQYLSSRFILSLKPMDRQFL